eukprot:IDg13243t1
MPRSRSERWTYTRSIVDELEDEQRATGLSLELPPASVPCITFDPISPGAIASDFPPHQTSSQGSVGPSAEEITVLSSTYQPLAGPAGPISQPLSEPALSLLQPPAVVSSSRIVRTSQVESDEKPPYSSPSVTNPALTFELLTPPVRQRLAPLHPTTRISEVSSAISVAELIQSSAAAPVAPITPAMSTPSIVAAAPLEQRISQYESLSDVSSSAGASSSDARRYADTATTQLANLHASPIHKAHVPPLLPQPAMLAAMPMQSALQKRNVARIEINPNAPPAQQSTYVGERDKRLLDRKERNRKSAARSNQRRKQARMELEKDLLEATQEKEKLEKRRKKLEE